MNQTAKRVSDPNPWLHLPKDYGECIVAAFLNGPASMQVALRGSLYLHVRRGKYSGNCKIRSPFSEVSSMDLWAVARDLAFRVEFRPDIPASSRHKRVAYAVLDCLLADPEVVAGHSTLLCLAGVL